MLTYSEPQTAREIAARAQGAKQQGHHGSGCPRWVGGAPLARRRPEKSKDSMGNYTRYGILIGNVLWTGE